MNHGGLEYLRFVLQAVSEKNGPVRVVGRYAAMTTLNQSRIERNEIHVGSESQFLSINFRMTLSMGKLILGR